ncbi:MAG: NADPH:quinone oxidoreductase family protein [Novosphingobium sp.]|nr:NADPH:quinone oxidoreductase family protein [Novosphingobium sp.]
MPRAVTGHQFGPPETYKLEEFEPREPGPSEVRLAIKAIGISYVDVLTALGKYQVSPPLPFIPGSECAGIVEAVGDGVSHIAVGDRVMGSSFGGIFAEANTFRASSFSNVPKALTIEQAAVFPPSYMTGYHALVDRGRLRAGETLLVLGAAGATGVAAIQVGKHLGARVIASASSRQKRELALKAGADAAIDTRSPTWRDDLKAANGGKPIDVVFDPVGGDMTDPAFRSLGYDGRYLVVGFTGGISSLKTNLPLIKTASLIGVQLRVAMEQEPDKANTAKAAIGEMAANGELRPVIGKTYPLEDYVAAMNDAFEGKTAGRIVMLVG